ncbi:hypothetical protein LTS01_002768 [Friedmanniomyces endolithicus]|nr:hypothetical protein LTS01_002768 [Friedmanniomyces endolithicus]
MERESRLHEPATSSTPAYSNRTPSPRRQSLYDWAPAHNDSDPQDNELDAILGELRRQQPDTHPDILRVLSQSQLEGYPAYYNFTVSPGNTYDYQPYNSTVAAQVYNAFYGPGNCLDQLNDCNDRKLDDVCSSADNFCYNNGESVYDTVTGRDEYDIRELAPDPFPYTNFVAYLNTPKVQKAIGAYTNFSYSVTNLGAGTTSTAFGTTGDDARELGIIAAARKLLQQGVSILQYAGDADYNCNWLGGEAIASEINAPGWLSAGYQNLSTPDGIVHGVVKQAGNFSFVRVYDAGHSVPFYKPLAALEMFERMLRGADIATGEVGVSGGYKSEGPAKSRYVNGNGTIQMGVTDPSCTYDVELNVPVCAGNGTNGSSDRSRR